MGEPLPPKYLTNTQERNRGRWVEAVFYTTSSKNLFLWANRETLLYFLRLTIEKFIYF